VRARFDSPSIFGSLLDREAGSFRFGPFGINVPSARIYEPGTNTLLTTWKTSTGWALVRDALTMGPTRGQDRVTPHTRPPADEDADHMLVRTVLNLHGTVEIELVCEPLFDFARTLAEWTMLDGDNHTVDASGAGVTVRLRSDMPMGIEGDRVRARHVLQEGEQAFYSLSWAEDLESPTDLDDAHARRHDAFLACLAREGAAPRPSLARAHPTLGAGDEAPDVHADPGPRSRQPRPRCPRRREASATGTTATPGYATPPSRCRRFTSSSSTGKLTS
jgi:hypothetical protein